jgi:tRNA (guanine37-N1)-methyltransferase
MMLIQILTLFPEMFQGPLSSSILKRAREQGLVEFQTLNFREFATDRHRTVDDTPYGGGSGMVLKPEPIYHCLQQAKANAPAAQVILLTPQGERFTQGIAAELAHAEQIIFICGHYEGFDERIRAWADRELSIGDYVLTGGEPAAIVISDAVVRLLPGVLGAEDSAEDDSFQDGLLEYPQYTRPIEFDGVGIPEVLLSGHHGQIERWRRQQALLRTAQRRPELLKEAQLTAADQKFLNEELKLKI